MSQRSSSFLGEVISFSGKVNLIFWFCSSSFWVLGRLNLFYSCHLHILGEVVIDFIFIIWMKSSSLKM